jgi:hypothetical protein
MKLSLQRNLIELVMLFINYEASGGITDDSGGTGVIVNGATVGYVTGGTGIEGIVGTVTSGIFFRTLLRFIV